MFRSSLLALQAPRRASLGARGAFLRRLPRTFMLLLLLYHLLLLQLESTRSWRLERRARETFFGRQFGPREREKAAGGATRDALRSLVCSLTCASPLGVVIKKNAAFFFFFSPRRPASLISSRAAASRSSWPRSLNPRRSNSSARSAGALARVARRHHHHRRRRRRLGHHHLERETLFSPERRPTVGRRGCR